MLYWSLKTLLSEPMRLSISAMAVAASFILVIFFSAVFEGESEHMVTYLEKMDADLWVMQKGVSNMHMASSAIWDWKVERIAQLPGVKEVAAILYLNGPVKVAGNNWYAYIIGVSPEYPRAGPWDLERGKAMPGPGEAIIPAVMAKLSGLQIGDSISLTDRKLRVVGLSRNTFSMASSIIFVSKQDLGDLMQGSDQFSYVMIYTQADAAVPSLVERIQAEVDNVNVMRSEDFIESDKQLAIQMGAELIRIMVIIGTLLATSIVAFTSYSLVARKKRELAIAKSLGFSNAQLYAAALLQSLVITLLGLLLALLLSFTVMPWLPTAIPQINLAVRLHQFVPLAIISLPVAILASLGAVRTVARLDPMSVFHR